MTDTAARLLRLLSLLQTRRQWTGPELADRLGVSVRTVRGDMERLRSLDYEIDATPGITGGYRLKAGTALPPLQLDDDEAVAVAIGLHLASGAGLSGIGEPAARAAGKLQQLLPVRLRHRLQTIDTAAEAVPDTRAEVPHDVFASIAAAVQRHEQLRFDYAAPSPTKHSPGLSHRTTEPHRLVHASGRWYLVGYDLDRQDWRTYRVDRITPKTPTGPRFAPRELPGPALATFVTRGRMAALWNYTARILVNAPAETVAARIPTGIWAVEPVDSQPGAQPCPHTCMLEAGAQSPQLLAAYLGAMDLDFHVDSEQYPELAAATATLATRYAAALRPSAR